MDRKFLKIGYFITNSIRKREKRLKGYKVIPKPIIPNGRVIRIGFWRLENSFTQDFVENLGVTEVIASFLLRHSIDIMVFQDFNQIFMVFIFTKCILCIFYIYKSTLWLNRRENVWLNFPKNLIKWFLNWMSRIWDVDRLDLWISCKELWDRRLHHVGDDEKRAKYLNLRIR